MQNIQSNLIASIACASFLVLSSLPAFANYFTLKVCNGLNSYGFKEEMASNGKTKYTQLYPLKHNIEYVFTPNVKDPSSPQPEQFSSVLLWSNDGNCKDPGFFTNQSYPISADLKITDQQTGIVLWHGLVSAKTEKGDLSFDPKSTLVDDNGELISFAYFPAQITVSRDGRLFSEDRRINHG